MSVSGEQSQAAAEAGLVCRPHENRPGLKGLLIMAW